jgi:hypothetical protein
MRKSTNKKLKVFIISFLVAALSFFSCNTIREIGFEPQDKKIVEDCRNNWMYEDLKDTITIRLLLLDKKGRYDIVSWPNLFIGITNDNDTIGLIDDFSTKDFKINSLLTFVPYDYGIEIGKSKDGLTPVFTVHKKDKENKLYCSIKSLFYGKLTDK